MSNQISVIKSGNCIMGVIGTPTHMTDVMGKDLFVGDLVRLYRFDEDGRVCDLWLTLTYVSQDFNTFSDGRVSCSGVSLSFIMGIKDCKLGEKDSDGRYWHVKKIKRYKLNKPSKSKITPHHIENIEMPESFLRLSF